MKKSFGLACVVAVALSSCLNSDPITGPTVEEQLKKDSVIISDYLSSKGLVAQIDPDNYGVRYIINSAGTGIKPSAPPSGDSVTVNYTLRLLPSETQIEKSDKPAKFLLANLIGGWQIGLPLIKEGSKATFYVPSGWGYGGVQSGDIPANSNLIFDIELVKVSPQITRDTVAINLYLKSKDIKNVIKDPSGLRYVITTPGTGAKPSATNTVTLKYVGKTMSSETIFDQSTAPVEFNLSKVSIKGFQIGVTLMQVGSKATLYIPSTLGWGIRGAGSVGSNANLIYEVELVSIN
jgi:FKBP-type peptidyl-prolyl cis-trans isomerase FkpA